jgi:GDPmannose 4,6-dehydratase
MMNSPQKRALIIGVNGQDGSYLAELLLAKGYHVTGWVRRADRNLLNNLCSFHDRIELVIGDLTDPDCYFHCVGLAQPDEVYNLAAPSMPFASWQYPAEVADLAGVSVIRLLETLRKERPQVRFYQASTSEMFGTPVSEPQNEDTPFNPRNPYGAAKLLAHTMVRNYAEKYGLFAVSGILFNHESPRRGYEFVTRKITLTAAAIALGMADHLPLGDVNARRDWGFAPDYVQAMWLMLQQDQPESFVIGTGETHTVREVCEIAFTRLGLDYRDFVTQDPAFMRPPEKHLLVADAAKARQRLNWAPSLRFEELITLMVDSDLAFLQTTERLVTSPLNCAELESISQGIIS